VPRWTRVKRGRYGGSKSMNGATLRALVGRAAPDRGAALSYRRPHTTELYDISEGAVPC
jgi:hypothetical protein